MQVIALVRGGLSASNLLGQTLASNMLEIEPPRNWFGTVVILLLILLPINCSFYCSFYCSFFCTFYCSFYCPFYCSFYCIFYCSFYCHSTAHSTAHANAPSTAMHHYSLLPFFKDNEEDSKHSSAPEDHGIKSDIVELQEIVDGKKRQKHTI